jgi:putative exosortase-associated protein (TIGR04073 family)
MMKSGKLLMAALTMVAIMVAVSPTQTFAQDKAHQEYIDPVLKPIWKLSRGIANVVFSPLEIPMKWHDVQQQDGGIVGITYGTLKGIVYMFARIGVGVIDIATFPIPLPNCPESPQGYGAGYGPLMRPAWVVDIDHDWNNFVYSNENIGPSEY